MKIGGIYCCRRLGPVQADELDERSDPKRQVGLSSSNMVICASLFLLTEYDQE